MYDPAYVSPCIHNSGGQLLSDDPVFTPDKHFRTTMYTQYLKGARDACNGCEVDMVRIKKLSSEPYGNTPNTPYAITTFTSRESQQYDCRYVAAHSSTTPDSAHARASDPSQVVDRPYITIL
ncbi:hypothetical protein Trydic_g22603 [Trypoxylus dichotomus]